MTRATHGVDSARAVAARALASAAAEFPRLSKIQIRTEGLAQRDAALAVAIHRLTLQRWVTIEYLLDQMLYQPLVKIEPDLRGLLMSAAAPILFMDRQPSHAVVDEAVNLARQTIRSGAAGLVNAVLRRLSELVGGVVHGQPWSPGADRIPLTNGFVHLAKPCLPPPEQWEEHLAIATSHPVNLVHQWSKWFGRIRTCQLCLDSLRTPPTIVAVEASFDPSVSGVTIEPHKQDGFVLWRGRYADLVAFLAGHSARRVQDPGSGMAIRDAAPRLRPTMILDYCAGRGTKTTQLADAFPDATVIATDVDSARVAVMRSHFAARGTIRVVELGEVQRACGGKADLILLDVPCSNTAVLARRPEAKYRCCRRAIESLVRLQRRIAERAIQFASARSAILYSTCSLDEVENQQQVAWLANTYRLEVETSELTLPSGYARQYQDGCFHALLRIGPGQII